MQNFVISLTTAQDRRAHITTEFNKHEVEFSFFDALTPSQAQEYASSIGLNLESATLSLGELACMMSHVALWQKAIAENMPYITIFEDDVYLGDDAKDLLNSYEWVNPDWDIIKIEAFAKKTYLSTHKQKILAGRRHIVQLKGKNLGTAGYILSQQGAKIYLDYLLTHPLLPLDRLMFDDFISRTNVPVQQLIPALCIQEMLINKDNPALPSALLNDRKTRMQAEKQTGVAKINKEVTRVIKQAKKSLLAKQIPFK